MGLCCAWCESSIRGPEHPRGDSHTLCRPCLQRLLRSLSPRSARSSCADPFAFPLRRAQVQVDLAAGRAISPEDSD